jgi:hypothetical protein
LAEKNKQKINRSCMMKLLTTKCFLKKQKNKKY